MINLFRGAGERVVYGKLKALLGKISILVITTPNLAMRGPREKYNIFIFTVEVFKANKLFGLLPCITSHRLHDDLSFYHFQLFAYQPCKNLKVVPNDAKKS